MKTQTKLKLISLIKFMPTETLKMMFIDFLYRVKNNLTKNYKNDKSEANNTSIVFMVDGKKKSGGLAERLKAAVFAYQASRALSVDYKINYTYPDNLSDYLLPNEYNWLPEENFISYNHKSSIPVIVDVSIFRHAFGYPLYLVKVLHYMCMKFRKYKQIHLYHNVAPFLGNMANDFHFLFKPSQCLQEAIDIQLNNIGEKFISISFRFANSLGDFEDVYEPLSSEEKNALMETCIQRIEDVYDKNKHFYEKVFVCSDSNIFWREASKLQFTHIIEGETQHLDLPHKINKPFEHMKQFLEFFMMSKSEKIYFVVEKNMYPHSFFPKFAAIIGDKPYVNVEYGIYKNIDPVLWCRQW